ncbi:hypothetical protein AAXE64_27395 [Priestia megaterium]
MQNQIIRKQLELDYIPSLMQEGFVKEVVDTYFKQCDFLNTAHNETDTNIPFFTAGFSDSLDLRYFVSLILEDQQPGSAESLLAYLDSLDEADCNEYLWNVTDDYGIREYHEMFHYDVQQVLQHYQLCYMDAVCYPLRHQTIFIVENQPIIQVW